MNAWDQKEVGLLHGLVRGTDASVLADRLSFIQAKPILVRSDDLTAVLTLWPVADDGAPVLAAALSDAGRAAALALVHHEIMMASLDTGDVLPVRIGSVYATMDSVRQMLNRDRPILGVALDRITGSIEFGIRLSIAAATGQAVPEVTVPGSGRAYLRKLADADQARRSYRQNVQALRTRLADELRDVARAIASRPAQQQSASVRMLGELAVLVSRAAECRLHEAIERHREAAAVLGVTLTVTGPWPPYSFATLAETEEASR